MNNIITLTDSYKFTHWRQYPKGTEKVMSYFESRPGAFFDKTVFFGLQYIIKKYLLKPITREDIDNAKRLSKAHFGTDELFNEAMWEHILKVHDGKLPIMIKAVPEGTPVDVDNVLMTVENTDPKCYPLTNHLETILTHVWSASTTATLSYYVYNFLKDKVIETGESVEGVKFMLHDFGFRGVSSVESAGFQGAGHLLNFLGTDTIAAMRMALKYYNADINKLAFSVPATEHSVMTSLGRDGEEKLFENLLESHPTGILSVVIDSYDYLKFINTYAKKFKDKILQRDGKLVFRPDSGDPVKATIKVLNELEKVFGATNNKKGFKELNSKVGVLWGDGIGYYDIIDIVNKMIEKDYAVSNIVFGMGGGLLQKVNRDTQRFAFKCCLQVRDGVAYDIQKNPVDSGKKSKGGELALGFSKETNKYFTYDLHHLATNLTREDNKLELVYLDGILTKEYSFEEVRKNTGNWD